MNNVQRNSLHSTRSIIVSEGSKVAELIPVPVSVSPERAQLSSFFLAVYGAIQKEVPFNPSWANGTGYFDGILRDQKLLKSIAAGSLVKSVDPDGKRILIGMTANGPIVVFQRYVDNCAVLVTHSPYKMREADETVATVLSGALNLEKLRKIIFWIEVSRQQ